MKNKKWKVLTVLVAVLVLVFALGTAEASQKYVTKTGKGCASCHEMAKIPTLNAFGKQFKASGYKIVATKKGTTVKVVAPKVVAQNDRKYVGSDKCAMCHGAAYDGWKKSYHSKMVQKRDVGILKEAVTSWAADSAGTPGPTIGNATKEKVSILDVQYTIGNKWKQRYLVKNNLTGGLQLMDKQFNVVTKAWESYGNANDWDTECITCHSTGYQITKYDAKNPAATQVKYAELNVGCEACHGPGSAHVVSSGKVDIFNPAKQSKEVQARICGACHSRIENEKFLTRQGNPREDLPAPILNTSWKPWDDITKWYPELLIFPGVQPEDQASAAYTGDLKDMFFLDDQAKKQGVYEERKHHQEYQGFIQSNHYTTSQKVITCTTCHNVHNRTVETGSLRAKPEELCSKCHTNAAPEFWQKTMPGTGKTANNLYVRSHTFVSGQSRPDAGKTAYGTPEPVYYFKK